MAKAVPWKEVKREVVYKKYSQIVERRDYLMPDGEVRDYYIHVEVPGACALGITEDNMIITLPQYRPGPGMILTELPGGRVDDGEDPRLTAARELLEESGYQGETEDWTGTWQADAYTQLNRTIVIVKNCKKVAEPDLETTEFGEVELLSVPEFLSVVRAGKLSDTAGAMIALDHLGLLK